VHRFPSPSGFSILHFTLLGLDVFGRLKELLLMMAAEALLLDKMIEPERHLSYQSREQQLLHVCFCNVVL
jgi:hypothetical protein